MPTAIDRTRVSVTTSDASERSGLSTTHLTRLLRSGQLEGVQLGKEWLIYTDSLEKYVATPHKPGPRGPVKRKHKDQTTSQRTESQQNQITASKEQLIQDLIDAHEKLIAAASAAYERGIKQTKDVWGPREILAHVAGWEAMAVARIPPILAGIPPIKYVSEAQHAAWDNAVNAMVITMIGDQPFDAICAILRKMYQVDVQLISGLDERAVRPGSYVYERTKAAIDHCYEHIHALEQLQLA